MANAHSAASVFSGIGCSVGVAIVLTNELAVTVRGGLGDGINVDGDTMEDLREGGEDFDVGLTIFGVLGDPSEPIRLLLPLLLDFADRETVTYESTSTSSVHSSTGSTFDGRRCAPSVPRRLIVQRSNVNATWIQQLVCGKPIVY